MRGVAGSLAAADVIDAIADGSPPRDRLRSLVEHAQRHLGPASGARHVFDVLVAPLLAEFGLEPAVALDSAAMLGGVLVERAGRAPLATLAVCGWDGDLSWLRAATARLASAGTLRWWIGCNGPTLRILDATRAYSRRALDIGLDVAADGRAIAVLRHILSNRSGGRLAGLESLVDASERHRLVIGESLQAGVDTALTRLVGAFAGGRRHRRDTSLDAALAEALTVVYRILFLLFAEARELVPGWHPVYRASYTIQSLRPAVEGRRGPAGLWQSLQAITRLAHRGCRAGTLRVVPFNGRLFAPSTAPAADAVALDDRIARDVLLAITTRPARDRRERISYGDLGVEQLGAVYERVLDYSPVADGNATRLVSSGRRKRTGTFYTPRPVTEFLVRRTLAPLVRNRSSDAILQLRIVDPAMGSGAFLVSACRYLARAYEAALVNEGAATAAGLSATDRAGFRRQVAQRCLYGVDFNPTAVQLARLSLWLSTLAADRPLTFLDHHLRSGNSLAGASALDIARQSPGERAGRAPLPLFELDEIAGALSAVVTPRVALANEPDDTVDVVHRKERMHERLTGASSPLAHGRAAADAWCSAWFWPDGDRPPRAAWSALALAVRGRECGLPPAATGRWLSTIDTIARSQRFFHWDLEFPEVFFDEHGNRRPDGGFDAVLGNPPWETLRGDAGTSDDKTEARRDGRALTRFSRESGCFRFQGTGHANLYQLFAERMVQITAPHGRIGMLMPSGLFSDHGCAELRRHLLNRTAVDALLMFDNREALFPIHRSMRFALFTATKGQSTGALRTRFGLHNPSVLDDVPDEGAMQATVEIPLTLVSRFSGDDLAVPDLQTNTDRALLARILDVAPPLAHPRGWNVRVGRELNATDDRRHFSTSGLPVLEGKAIEPFRAHVDAAGSFIERATLAREFGRRVSAARPRLGYREVASSTNALTLIAAMIPAKVVTTHTIFCVKQPIDENVHLFLCGVFNSYVANWLVRLRGGTHVPAWVMHALPVPAPAPTDPPFLEIVDLARAAPGDVSVRPALQSAVADLYRLTVDEFSHVLDSFPLVAEADRDAALDRFFERSHTV